VSEALYVFDILSDRSFSASVGWNTGNSPYDPSRTAVPYGVCSLHGWWDTSRYTACPSCSSAAGVGAQVPIRIEPAPVPDPKFEIPVLKVEPYDGPWPFRCPVCEGRGWMPINFYSNLPVTGDEPCRSCENGVIWR
jgi:hypothetical protein